MKGYLVLVALVLFASSAFAWPAILAGTEIRFPLVTYQGGVLTPVPGPIVLSNPLDPCSEIALLQCVAFLP